MQLSLAQARHLQLAAQGLLTTPDRGATRLSLRKCIERMQLLQIDTIHVVARSPYLVLFSRWGNYPPQWLDDALASGHLFELWAHEACFAPPSVKIERTSPAGCGFGCDRRLLRFVDYALAADAQGGLAYSRSTPRSDKKTKISCKASSSPKIF